MKIKNHFTFTKAKKRTGKKIFSSKLYLNDGQENEK